MNAEDELALRDAALTGTRQGVSELLTYLTPVIQGRVAIALRAHGEWSTRRDVRAEVEDLSQEMMLLLFKEESMLLRAWTPERGASLRTFVGVIARRRTLSILRTAKRDPWRDLPMEDDELHRRLGADDGFEPDVIERDLLRQALLDLGKIQSERGREFMALFYERGLSNQEVVQETGMTPDAVTQRRSRLNRDLKDVIRHLSSEGFE